ncbi:GlsB/YeaQ/YmgE family stress response membrane protein [Candidatus Uhrbacteria bacterium CG_4_10_14_0_8_um_filter_58_22]|uniref:GlsB/YeaQ/YmgE family stress response membrane protein n=1 Tax=Candidatus Uhrbacteria bacterium CG_4_10_14_0_8_um_filter_58_22 TaxID=1975029 RepID=A0A2M7Q8Y7_9BACT|nr:MAG: hypothetical protein AUJ19_02285 [Parcubacteria group bacterium CG1_02_58_44]PIY61960.1 MAG: GlsB/YeaQ/YmgE family stress response membrane protein [Candidatus Uhrbacteria bacterium CG_4_10_14_0_8_um_filter_58_22]
MGIIIWIFFGGLVGWVASMIMGSQGGLIRDVIVGMIGALIGGYLMSVLGKSGVGGFNIYSFLVALLGSCILIAIVRIILR